MAKPNAKKGRVKAVASRHGESVLRRTRGRRRRWKWVRIPLAVLLLIPALQVAVVGLTRSLPLTLPCGLPIYVARFPSAPFINPPRTLPMWIEQVSANRAKAPLRYRWIPLSQIPEMFLHCGKV
jgi:hypothetical protein